MVYRHRSRCNLEALAAEVAALALAAAGIRLTV